MRLHRRGDRLRPNARTARAFGRTRFIPHRLERPRVWFRWPSGFERALGRPHDHSLGAVCLSVTWPQISPRKLLRYVNGVLELAE